MKKHLVELSKTNQFSSFFLDYLEGKEKLRPFFTHVPNLESFKEAIHAKEFSFEHRMVLVRSLEMQYQSLGITEAVLSNIKRLEENTTFTVTTGHQLNLFTGPLYFIYKIISTINLSKKLKQAYPDFHFVPVYWMATEDHDFDEINFFKLDGKKYEWKTNQTGAVGEFELDNSFREFLRTVEFAPQLFKDAYAKSKNLSSAVRNYVNDLFGEEGLLVLDGNDKALKTLFKQVILSDLMEHKPFERAKEVTGSLESLGYKSQIFPREINLFYLEKGIRERIERFGDEFRVNNTKLSFSKEELKRLVEDHPERFSPNVVLRPIYQEMILPNLAYLGGPAEVVYWLQLKGIFDFFEIPFPVLMPRNFALIVETLVLKKMDQLDWTPEDLFVDFEQWKNNYTQAHSKFDFSLASERTVISDLFEKKGKEASSLDLSLVAAFEAGKFRSLKILDQMGKKLRKAEERRLQVDLTRAKSVLESCSPGGSPQERVVNMMQFYLARPEFLEELKSTFDPFNYHMMVLELT